MALITEKMKLQWYAHDARSDEDSVSKNSLPEGCLKSGGFAASGKTRSLNVMLEDAFDRSRWRQMWNTVDPMTTWDKR